MNREELLVLIRSKHKPELKDEPMVYQLWEDGELTLTKGGELFGARNLHLMEFGNMQQPYKGSEMPEVQQNGHGYIFCEREDAMMLREHMGRF